MAVLLSFRTVFGDQNAPKRSGQAGWAATTNFYELPGNLDIPAATVTASWRQNNVLAPVYLDLNGPLIDLTDHTVLNEIELRHAAALAAVGMAHLDLHELTTRVRSVTQQIATDVYERLEAAAIRFPSSRDGNVCFAVFEGRGTLVAAGDLILLTDPAPEALRNVAASWTLQLQAAAPIDGRPANSP